MEEVGYRKRARADPEESDSDPTIATAKKFKDDLLSILDEPEPVPDPTHDLDSVIRSFEEEITRSESSQTNDDVIDLTAGSGDLGPQLDDVVLEGNEIGEGVADLARIGELWNFEDEFTSYDDSFGVGLGCGEVHENYSGNDYVAVDGIFDYYSDGGVGVNFGSDFLWRSDTLPAL